MKMLKKNRKMILVTTLMCMAPVIIGLILWNKLPESVPMHFNVAGKVDGWSSKLFAVIGLPAIMLVCHMVCVLALCIDPKLADDEMLDKNKKVIGITYWCSPILSIFICSFIYAVALGYKINITFIMMIFMSVLFIIIGNYLPKCKQNYSIGIKVPWTLNDEDNWNKTHRFAGRVWVIGGVLLLVANFFNNPTIIFIIIMILAFVPIIYSIILFIRKKNKEN